MVASSMSMTGMSSAIGYTRWQAPHFRPAPSCTGVTGVLHFGHARISRSSASTAITAPSPRKLRLYNRLPPIRGARTAPQPAPAAPAPGRPRVRE